MNVNIAQQEKELFKEWRVSTPNLSEDGIIDAEAYLKSNIKILFLLKEVNSEDGFDLKKFVKDGGRTQTWDNIARWTCGIQNWTKDFDWEEKLVPIKNIEARKEWLKYICVMNIKKTPGGHTTNSKNLRTDSSRDGEFLERQFKLYYQDLKLRPDFIIGCGTETTNLFHEIVPFAPDEKWKNTKRGVFYYEYDKGKFFIKYAHPEARVADNLLYYGLIDAIKELKSNVV